VWTVERATRSGKPVKVADGHKVVIHDRTSAHVAAWHSPKRDPSDVGKRFGVKDARNWMRLMFWAARDNDLFDNKRFESWYIRFIAHFVRTYERSAPQFARESARWSEDPARIQEYVDNGYVMIDIHEAGLREAMAQLPPHERQGVSDWPYDD